MGIVNKGAINMELGEVLSKAWKIIWKNKILWIFGILASCGRSGGGGGGGGNTGGRYNLPTNNGNFNFDNGNNPFSNGQFPGMEEFGRKFEQFLGNGNQPPWGLIIGLICLIFFIGLIIAFFGAIGRSGLIRGTILAEEGLEPLHFGKIWSESSPYFIKVFLLNFLSALVIGIVVLILMVPIILLTIGTMGIGVMCLVPLICLLIPISWVISVILEQANVALISENLGLWEAIKRGWNVCRDNLGPVAVVALIVVIGGGIISFIISLPIILALIPLGVMMFSQDQSTMTTALSTTGVLLCCMIPVVIVLKGILQSYIGSVWTLTFLRLTKSQSAVSDYQAVSPTPMPE
jgi:hypothetical protein